MEGDILWFNGVMSPTQTYSGLFFALSFSPSLLHFSLSLSLSRVALPALISLPTYGLLLLALSINCPTATMGRLRRVPWQGGGGSLAALFITIFITIFLGIFLFIHSLEFFGEFYLVMTSAVK